MRPTLRSGLFCFLLLVPILVFSPLVSAQKQATLIRPTNLRPDPSTDNPPLQTLSKGSSVSLLAPKPTNGFFHVRTAGGKEGWVSSGNVLLSGTSAQVSRKLVRRPAAVETEPGERAAVACATDLSSCPDTGCSSTDSPHGLANQLKRRTPGGGAAALLTFDDFQSLQNQADSLVGENKELKAEDRAKLSSLSVSTGSVSEGDLVSIVGFLVGVPHPNTGESVNCNLKGAANNDFHIPISNDPGNSDFQGIVVEMIPQGRPDLWSLANLTQVENAQRLVLVTGSLFYDNFHFVNSDSSSPKGGQPHRFSLWEVHPISQFSVCVKDDNSCDPANTSDWTPLGVNP